MNSTAPQSQTTANTGGAAAIRGFLVQTLVALLDITQAQSVFTEITLEPQIGNDQFDFYWKDADGAHAVQVKSTRNDFKKTDIEQWAKKLQAARKNEQCRLILVGNIPPKLNNIESVDLVKIESMNLKAEKFVGLAANSLAIFLESEQMDAGTAKEREKVVHALTSKLEHLSTRSEPLTRPDFIQLLSKWIQTAKIKVIHSDRLPTVKGAFFGREEDLGLLNQAWQFGSGTHIVQFIAAGGTGKTKLLRHWLDNTPDIPALIAWSFYSQGSSEDKQVSASSFFEHLFNVLGAARRQFTSEEEKGDYLADLLREQRCVLILDGLEPLQHLGRGMLSELKDRAIRQLLKNLASRNNGLCIITTRIAVHDLSDRAHVVSKDLHNLKPEDGVSLLRSLGVKGSESDLLAAVNEYGCHALALHLLGNAVHTYLEDDVRKRDTLDELLDDYDAIGRHAFKVMQAYSRWLSGTPELQPLYLLGLFDHPIETEVLQVLWRAQIPKLTASIPEKAWKMAIRDLREKHQMLSEHENNPKLLDCHPLIREYFGKRLQTQHPDAWRKAHKNLYEYYKKLPKKQLPVTLEEMRPLFHAVAHGCEAGLHNRVVDEVYYPRIQRKEEFFIVRKLGAFSDGLATLSCFFTTLWQNPSTQLKEILRLVFLGTTGSYLRALGRLHEALESMQAAVEMALQQKAWIQAARIASNLSELQLILGNLAAATLDADQSVEYADNANDWSMQMICLSTDADALHQAGLTIRACKLFETAETLQRKHQPDYPHLYSVQGFHYCDLLLVSEDNCGQISTLERATRIWEWANSQGALLDIALAQLTLAKAHLQNSSEGTNFQLAADWLMQAVSGLREAGQQQYLPLGLLSRAAYYRHTLQFALAHEDLAEVLDIAEPSGMRLHLTDYHLEFARLVLAEFPVDSVHHAAGLASAESHIKDAEKLIQETGYHRRDAELQKLRNLVLR